MMTGSRDEAPRRPLKLFTGLLHLASLGVVGTIAVTVLFTMLATGIGLVPVLGIGLLILIGVVYGLFGTAWFETRRVAGLYRMNVTDLSFAEQRAPGFGEYLKMLWRQSINGRMWRALANLTIGSILGLVELLLMQEVVRQLLSFPAAEARVFGIPTNMPNHWGIILGSIAFSIVGIVLVGLLHRTVSIAIIDGGANEAQLRDQVRSTEQQREGAMRAADVERTRIERDLHDGVQPRLVSIGMTLGLAKDTIESNPDAAKQLIDEAHTSTKAAVTELRQLARGIHASVLDDRGLDAALSALAARSHIPVFLDSRIEGSAISREAQTAVYFAVAEALTNAAKHSLAGETRVTLRVRATETGAQYLWARVEDNGVGGATVQPGGGLDGIINRITAAGGSTRIDSPGGGPTTIEVSVPCAS